VRLEHDMHRLDTTGLEDSEDAGEIVGRTIRTKGSPAGRGGSC
jgi:hypothetical protein